MPTATNPPTPTVAPPTETAPRSSLPPPSTFDFLPPLHTLLTRLLLPTNNGHLPPSNSPQSSQSDQPLSPKDLAIAASAITAKIQKARIAVRAMEGVEMSLQEQEEIIAELEEEVARGKGMLDNLRDNCARVTEEFRRKDEETDGAGGEKMEDGGVGES